MITDASNGSNTQEEEIPEGEESSEEVFEQPGEDEEVPESELPEETPEADSLLAANGRILGVFKGTEDLAKGYRELEKKFTQTSQQSAELRKVALSQGYTIDASGNLIPPGEDGDSDEALSALPVAEPSIEVPFWMRDGYKPNTRYNEQGQSDENGTLHDEWGAPYYSNEEWQAYAKTLAEHRDFQDEEGNPDPLKISIHVQNVRTQVEQERTERIRAAAAKRGEVTSAYAVYNQSVSKQEFAKESGKAKADMSAFLSENGIGDANSFIRPYMAKAKEIVYDSIAKGNKYMPGYADMALQLAIADNWKQFVTDVFKAAKSQTQTRPRPQNYSGDNKPVNRQMPSEKAANNSHVIRTDGAGDQRTPVGSERSQGNNGNAPITREVVAMAENLGIKSRKGIQQLANDSREIKARK